MRSNWVEPDIRDEVVDFVNHWSEKTHIPISDFAQKLAIPRAKFYDWRKRYGQANQHNGHICRDHQLQAWERQAIIDFARSHRLEGYRCLTYLMMDQDIVAVSPSTVYRILKPLGLLKPWTKKTRTRGHGFHQPAQPHQHWHIDISHVKVAGTFFLLATVLDGYSRAIIDWILEPSMTSHQIQLLLQSAREKVPDRTPRIISDNGPQFISREFKQLVRQLQMTHVTTSPGYPQSNGKQERWYKSLKSEGIRPYLPISLADARRIIGNWVQYYNNQRLHSAIGYVTPADMLAGRRQAIHHERDRKLQTAREQRRLARLTPQSEAIHA